jgi:predicted unusual protein kinase regulating ubiquinone biosynthesis (AarF/ABC1/UbiB family)
MQGIDRKRLAKLSVECYLEQLLTYGFFHAGVTCAPSTLII